MPDEMFQRNASKFTIFLEYENPHSFFLLIISCYFINEKRKKLHMFLYSKNMANFEAFHIGRFINHKPLISEECISLLSATIASN